jgi:hypothetical protein
MNQDSIDTVPIPQNMATTMSPSDKGDIAHVESVEHDEPAKPVLNEKMDEFGAAAKTDPKEIALVKKLDWYMMVSSVPLHNRAI